MIALALGIVGAVFIAAGIFMVTIFLGLAAYMVVALPFIAAWEIIKSCK